MTVDLQTYEGVSEGMARYAPQHRLGDQEAWTLWDVILNRPGFISRRGRLDVTNSVAGACEGLARTVDPAGTESIIALVHTTTSNQGRYMGLSESTVNDVAQFNPDSCIFDSKDMLNGGALIGAAPAYGPVVDTVNSLVLWRGAAKPGTSTTAAALWAQGATSITLASAAAVVPGHFVLGADGTLVGVVKAVNTTTNVITLEQKALKAGANTDAVTLLSFRKLSARVSKGRITTSTASTEVNGGGTKFKAQALSSSWKLYTPDMTFIGTVSSVAGDAQLTLGAVAAVSLLNSDYIAIKDDTGWTTTPAVTGIGWLNAQFAGHQFYADGNTVSFSDSLDPEALDLTANGDNLVFSADPVRALVPTQQALVVLTEKEAHSLVGAVGTTPDRWRGERIHDDGTLCGMSALGYQGGAIWAGTRGLWYWDGADPVNMAGKLGEDYRTLVAGVTRARATIVKDHYLLYLEDCDPEVFTRPAGDGGAGSGYLTLVVNLRSGAICMWSNVEIKGMARPPGTIGMGTSTFAVNALDVDGATVTTWQVNADTLFDPEQSSLDDVQCTGGAELGGVSPSFYLETKKYDLGDGQRLKLFKMLLLNYKSAGGNIRLDTVKGLNDEGVIRTAEFQSSDDFIDKRLKPKVRSQFAAYRLYQSEWDGDPDDLEPANHTEITLAQWALAFKWKRPGRV